MNNELTSYLKTEMIIAAAFNFFINGMCAGLIHHKADYVATDIVSIAIDLTCTCLFTFIISAMFCKASIKQTKTAGILETKNRFLRFSGKLFQRSVLFGVIMGFITAAVLWVLTATLFMLIGVYALQFGLYVALKCLFAALLGGGVAFLELYSGMCKFELIVL